MNCALAPWRLAATPIVVDVCMLMLVVEIQNIDILEPGLF
jgi:hypothetical protein